MISIIVPIYNEEKTLVELHQRILNTLQRYPESYEIIFVNDCSTDGSYGVMRTLTPLKIISLQRNYGETAALDVGIQNAIGDIIIFLDGDLQNNPEDILKLLEKIKEGNDVVAGWRQNRKDSFSRILFSRFSNLIIGYILGVKIHDLGCGLKAYRARFIKDFRLWGQSLAFLPAVAKERGAVICELPVAHNLRQAGHSKIGIWKMVKGIFDLISVVFIIKYFFKPFRFFGGWGAVAILLSVLTFGFAIFLRLAGILHFTETPLPTIGTLFAVMGVLLFMMGLLAEILVRTYNAATNNSPQVVREIKENR